MNPPANTLGHKMATEHPDWVRRRVFVIPETLKARLRDLGEEEQIKLCRVASEVVIKTKKNPILYKPISSREFKGSVGGDYKRFVHQLITWGIIEENRHWNNRGERRFCISYRLTHRSAAVPKERICFGKKIVQRPPDRSTISDDVSAFVHDNLKKLAIRSELVSQADLVDEVSAEQWASRVYLQQFNLKYSKKVKRMFHCVIVMPRVARRNLVLRDSPTTPLYEYDIRSCHPVLLLALIKDAKERSDYEQLLSGDIYTTIAHESGIEDERDDLKQDFLRFANGKATNYYHEYFCKRFPQLTQRIDAVRLNKAEGQKGLAWLCQSSEATIMTQIIPRLLKGSANRDPASNSNLEQDPLICGDDSGCFYIPMHDGWLGIERDEKRIAEAVRDDFYKRLGYWVTITKTPVTGGEKAIVKPEVAVEQVRWHR